MWHSQWLLPHGFWVNGMPRNYSCLECTYEYTQWMGQRCPSDSDTVITVNNIITYCLVKTEYDVTSSYSTHHVCCVTCPRNGPNWGDLRELPGQLRGIPMLPAPSTMERSIPSCWSLGEWIRMATLCRMHGSWMSTLGGGGRWVVMNVWLVQLSL